MARWWCLAAVIVPLWHSVSAFLPACTPSIAAATRRRHTTVQRVSGTADGALLSPPDRSGLLDGGNDEEDVVLDLDQVVPWPSDLPKPPFQFHVPGEQGSSTLCTDPDWTAAMLALKFFGLPFTVVNGGKDSAPALHMEDEIYDDADTIMSMLEERYVLSDIVQTVDGVLRRIRALRAVFVAFLLQSADSITAAEAGDGTASAADAALRKELGAELGRMEFRLKGRRDGGDFIEGDELTLGDLELATTLYHMRVALPHFAAWRSQVPDPSATPLLAQYADTFLDMAVFKDVAPSAEQIIKRYADLGAIVRRK